MAVTDKNLFAYCDNNPVMRTDVGGEFWDVFVDIVSVVVSIVEVVQNPTSGEAWAALGADVACAVIPGVTGGGAVVRAVTKADDIADVAKVANTTKGWRVGDPITNRTRAGNEPSWTALRQRYWKNEAHKNPSKYSKKNLKRMRNGRAELEKGTNRPMELHHPDGREGKNFYNFEPLSHADHMQKHYNRTHRGHTM